MALTKVTGHVIKSDTNIISHNINSSGIITAVTFDGNVSGVAVTFTGDSTIGSLGITTNLTVGGNIDVDGHTDLDNVSISGVTTASDNVIIPDNKKLILGSVSGRQLHLYHNMVGSSNHVIESTSSSNHLIFKATTINPRSNYFSFRNYAHNQDVFTVDADGQTKLFFNGNTKLETTNTGAVVSGILTVTGNMNVEGVLTYQDVTNIDSIGIVTARDHINIVTDNKKLRIGAGQDLQIYHSTFNYIESHNDTEIHINAYTGGSAENMAKFKPNGAVELYHNSSKKIETTSPGGTLTGDFTFTGNIYGGNHITIQDSDGSSDMLKIGASEDIRIYHYNNNSYIRQHTDLPLVIGGTTTGQSLYLQPKDGENSAIFKPDGAVELYHNNVKKIETATEGVVIPSG